MLHPQGLLEGVEEVTGHPSVEGDMIRSDQKVCFSNMVLTSQGPGTAIPFSLRLVELLLDDIKAKEIAD